MKQIDANSAPAPFICAREQKSSLEQAVAKVGKNDTPAAPADMATANVEEIDEEEQKESVASGKRTDAGGASGKAPSQRAASSSVGSAADASDESSEEAMEDSVSVPGTALKGKPPRPVVKRQENHSTQQFVDPSDGQTEPSQEGQSNSLSRESIGDTEADGSDSPTPKSFGRHARKAGSEENDIGSDDQNAESQAEQVDERIIGIGDRAYYLAMAAALANTILRPGAKKRVPLLPVLKPTSHAECRRRCGSDGFCDPSSELGCGGQYCPGLSDRL